MPLQSLLYQREYVINDDIKIIVPTVGEIIDHEDDYYTLITTITASPIDFQVQLDEIGIDYTEINEWDLFLLMFNMIQTRDTSLIFGDLDLSQFVMATNEENGQIVVANPDGVTIDRAILNDIATTLRKLHHIEKNIKKPANEAAKKYLLERARVKAKRNKNKKDNSQLEPLIVAMVNTEQYKYDFEGTRELSIYQFNESVRQVIKKVDYDNKMYGVYTGNIDSKELSNDELNWLTHK